MKRVQYLGFIASMVLANWVTPARAKDIDDSSRSAARALVKQGVDDLNADRAESALMKFTEALAVARVPTVAVWAAKANEKLGRLVAAAELYENALLMQPNELWVGKTQQQAQQQASKALSAVKPRIPTARIEIIGNVDGTDIDVTIDDAKVPNTLLNTERPLDPGKHVFVAKQGRQSATETLTLAEAAKSTVTLRLEETQAAVPSSVPGGASQPVGVAAAGNPPLPVVANASSGSNGPAPSDASAGSAHRATAAKRQRTLGWIGIGVGAGGVLFGSITGIIVGAKRSSLHSDHCIDNNCYGPSYNDRVDSYNSLRIVSGVGFVVGGVAAAAGVTLLLTSPKPRSFDAPKVSLMLTPGQLNLTGTY